MTSPTLASAFSAFTVSALATVAAWQVQLEFWLRIGATVVAIAAGMVSIYAALRRKRE